MPRMKVQLAFITDHNKRKACLKKRKEGSKKKMSELCTLCDVVACAIMYTPTEPDPDLWPSEEGVYNVLNQYMNTPDLEKTKNKFDHDDYIKKRIAKTEVKINKQSREKQEEEIASKKSECLSGKLSLSDLILQDLNDVAKFAGGKVLEIESRIKEIKKSGVPAASAAPPAAAPESQPLQSQAPIVSGNHRMGGGVAEDCYAPPAAVVDNTAGSTFNDDRIQTTTDWFSDEYWNAIDITGSHFGSCSRGGPSDPL